MDLNPIFEVRDGKLYSDVCVWCGQESKLSKSHLIPKYLGGRFSTYTSCEPCNNSLGSLYEALGENNVFLCAARAKLDLSDKKTAYRRAKKSDAGSGIPFRIGKNGKAIVIPGKYGKSGFRGSPKQIKEYRIKEFKRNNPDKCSKPLEEFFDDPVRSVFSFHDLTYFNKVFKEEMITLKVPQEGEVDPKFIFKIVYEFLTVIGCLSHPWFTNCMRRPITIDFDPQAKRIMIDDRVEKLVYTCIPENVEEGDKLEEVMDFDNYHSACLWLSRKINLYVLLTFFGQIRVFYLLGKCPENVDNHIRWFDKTVHFPCDSNNPETHPVPRIENKHSIGWADGVVDYRMSLLAKDESVKDILAT